MIACPPGGQAQVARLTTDPFCFFIGFFVWELVQGLSNFYTQSFGFLIATIVVTSIFILLDVISIVAARIFHRDLLRALEIGWRPSYKRTNPLYYYKKTSTTVVDEEDGGADEMRKVALNKSSINTRVTERTHLLKKQLIKD